MSDSLKFKLQLSCDNAAFDETPATEIARCLRDVASRMERGELCNVYRDIRDVNGNVVGQFALKPANLF